MCEMEKAKRWDENTYGVWVERPGKNRTNEAMEKFTDTHLGRRQETG